MAVAALGFFCMSMTAAGEHPPICPDESTILPTQHSASTKEFSLEFINRAGIALSLYWVNFDGKEVPVCLRSVVVFVNYCLVGCLRLGLFVSMIASVCYVASLHISLSVPSFVHNACSFCYSEGTACCMYYCTGINTAYSHSSLIISVSPV